MTQEWITPGLHIHGVGKWFGQRRVLEDVSFSVHRGEVAGLLGPNGAGKTTCFYIITGLVKPDTGLIYLDGNNLTATPMYQRARMGISYLAQEASIFRGMSVEQNILSVAELHERDSRRAHALVDALLDELHIGHLRRSPAVSLSGGERRRVEIARALATEPSFLLMDEPFAGLDPLAVDDIRKIVTQLKNRGLGILITDHNVKETLEIVDVASVIYDGSVLLEGAPREILSDPEVRRVYLGQSYAETLKQEGAEAAPSRRRNVFQPPQLDIAGSFGFGGPATADDGDEIMKKKHASLIFGAGAAAGLVVGLGLGVGVTMLKPEPRPAVQQSEAVTGADYEAALKIVDTPGTWTPAPLGWKHLPSFAAASPAPVTFETPATPYTYGGISQPLGGDVVDGDTIVRIDVSNVKGKVGVSLVNPAGEPILSQEQGLTPATGERAIFFRVSPAMLPAAILLRNFGDTTGKVGAATVKEVSYTPVESLSAEQIAALEQIGLNKPLQ